MLRVTYQNASDNLHKLQHLWDSVVGALLSEMLGKNVPASTTTTYSAKQPIYWQTPYASLLTEKRPDPLAHSFGLCATPRFSTLHDAFSYHASKHPLNIAVEHLGESITYAELDLLSSQLAKRLRARGVRPGTRVCLLVRRSIPMIVAIVAVLKAGGSYVPLDGGIVTDSTFSGILKESSPRIVLCSEKYVHRMDGRSVPAMCLEQTLEELRAAGDSSDSSLVLPDPARPSNEAYVIFTSGTTGKPKGVSVTHRNVTNLVCLSPGDLGIRPGMRVGQILNIAFDMCAWEILGCLTNGGTLVLRGTAAASWTAVLKSVDVLISTPSILLRHNPEDYPNIKVVATAGEPCPQSLADNWAKQAVFYNSCGPTEVTIINTVHRHRPGVPLTIGKPTPNNSVYVLDDDLQPVPEGQPGTLWAGGAGISNGYLNLPEITMKRYKPDPFNMRNGGGMMYNTGDLGRWTPDGMLEHLGRADDQVKVKGFRVELDGVAAAMNTCPGVTSSCALLIGDELWGFYESPGVDALPEEVKEATAKIQPYYAVPSKFMALPAVPLTSNGKTDKRMLRTLVEDLTVSASS